MVFIVKIPNRSRGNTPEASNTPANEQAPNMDAQTLPQAATSDNGFLQASNTMTQYSQAYTTSGASSASVNVPHSPEVQSQLGAELDVLVAPAVLNHRYVRGMDKSLIVERPERIRAVLLGIATAIGKTTVDESTPPLPTHSSFQSSGLEGPASSTTAAPTINTPAQDDDDLVARLNSLLVNSTSSQQDAVQAPQQKFRVLHSTRSLLLDPPHPAVAFTHAHSDELAQVLESAYDQAKQRRRDARAAVPDPNAGPSSWHSVIEVKPEREATPTPYSVADIAPQPAAESAPTRQRISHAAYLEYLCARAPNHPPVSHAKPQHVSPDQSLPGDSEAYTSSDGEGDDTMHLSEVPEHLPQGDLYLAGPSKEAGMDGGSSEAIRHAMGACCEAVDRVVAAVSAQSTSASTSLREIKYENSSSPDSDDASLPAKRAFVLSRPPGHHCSGSTPQGFCWVNNAVVASAHAYLFHAIDRVCIFDIDLHHGNGTQNLVWRINSDANKQDEERTERIAFLRAAALERARAAIVPGSGRAHAAKLAKVALTGEDERKVREQAGKRGLRVFYGSLHDIESFPCEDGDPGMIKDASTCVEGAHGQWIWNIHLDNYRTDSEFKHLYDTKYATLFNKASRFLTSTSATPTSTLILISAGFDACSYEYPGMQRHGKHVPPSFYHTFARDAVHFAESHAQGKLVSVLEGGYSDRALCSAALAHVTGLAVGAEASKSGGDEGEYWKLENLVAVEKVAKRMAAYAAGVGGAGSGSANTTASKRRQAELPHWLGVTSKAFAAFEQACGKKDVQPIGASGGAGRGSASAVAGPAGANAGRVLRDRGALKSKRVFERGSTPQQATTGRRATPTKGRRGDSPSKKESPTKARVSGGTVPVTPVKKEEEEDISMDTDMPTCPLKVETHASPLKVDPQPPSQSSHLTANVATAPLASTPVQQQPQQQQPRPSLAPKPTPPSISSFITTSSAPESPALTATPVTLVDAMSSPSHRIIDANTAHMHSHTQNSDPLGLHYLRAKEFHFANGEDDAEGSPDPLPLDQSRIGGASEAYFPLQEQQPHQAQQQGSMPGGFGTALAGVKLEHASLSREGGRGSLPRMMQQSLSQEKRKDGVLLDPSLPYSHTYTHSQQY
ncbi:related to HOS3-Trichostatin A-insensitive homodimeric histone deacetylase (HDAC) [Ustilago bromivora]|uniref:Related to HOS3-Trichostatin A-insensitive homodimeric histone deacetylase (HDAC) n=1 Tax=Ustilago bromivora TaxID=307758 RepID=A0A1K0GBC4_9BASI|nr:related to HOS3-Trichostatin A-insensitive homodimeric histone deacetylase (HDAC) [Ustilago bromivora]